MIDPKLLEVATPKQREYIQALHDHGSERKAAKALGVSRNAIACAFERVRKKASVRLEASVGSWVPHGHKIKGLSTMVKTEDGLPQWVKTSEDQIKRQEAQEAAYKAMAAKLPKVDPVAPPTASNADLCNLIVFSDYHLGQLAWHKEGGADWDLRIAESLLRNSFLHMLENAPKAGQCVICLQGDFLHTDGFLPLTPAHKHVLDADSRFPKIVDAGIRVIRYLIAKALETHDSVRLIVAEGNHDETSSMWFRKMFAAMYENEPRLSVDCSEIPYYVHQFGSVMLAFHHGHKVNNEQLPLLFASQYPKLWGDTLKRYCHTGHRHHVDEKEYSGMIVTQHATLAARDAHSARGGWISERAAQCITYHAKFGQVARTFVCPEMFDA